MESTKQTHSACKALLDWIDADSTREVYREEVVKYVAGYVADTFAPGEPVLFSLANNYHVNANHLGCKGAPDHLMAELACHPNATLLLWQEIAGTSEINQVVNGLSRVSREEAMALAVGENENIHTTTINDATITLSLPSFQDFKCSLPFRLRHCQNDPGRWTLRQIYDREVINLIDYATACKVSRVSLSLFTKQGHQWQAHFSVKDLSVPDDPYKVNWHGQNTSQWNYAGAIVVDDKTGEISGHH